jgi:transketolase
LSEAEGPRHLTFLATGSEVEIALATRSLLAEQGVQAAVVSMPCLEVFDAQPQEYTMEVLGSAPRYAIEAGSSDGWSRYVGATGRTFGVDRFGASAPAALLYADFGLTPLAIVEAVLTDLNITAA